MFKEGDETLETQTGQIVAETIKTSGADITIHFKSDSQGTRKGFKINVQYVLEGKIKTTLKNEYN